MKRRTALATLGAVSLGVAKSSLLMGGTATTRPLKMKKERVHTDILVVGGGTSGAIAAIQAGRAGKNTILVENGSQLGGTTTTGGVAYPGLFFAWGKQVIGGIGWELVQDTVLLNDDMMPDFATPHGRKHWEHQIRLNPALYSLLAEEKCIQAGVKIRYYESPIEVNYSQNKWTVTTIGKGTHTEITCGQLIDCTGNAFTTSLAGFNVLRETETQPGTLMFTLGGYDVEQLDLGFIQRQYDKAVANGEQVEGEFYSIAALLQNAGDNVQHIAGADSTTSETHTTANINGRASLLRTLRFLRKMPGCRNIKLVSMKTETAVRETYRIDGLYQVSHDDYVKGKSFEDTVSYSYYPIDLHDTEGVIPKQLDEGVVAKIPLRALIPKDSKNLLVAGRCISSDRLANSALRVQASCMGMGQAVGAIAALASDQKRSPIDVPINDIKRLIEQHGGITPL